MPNTIPEHEPQAQDASPAPAKRKKPLVVGVICVLVLLSAIGFFANARHQEEQRAAYIANLNELRAQAIRGGAIAEEVCNLTKNVWYNTIHEKKDSVTDKYTRANKVGAFHDDFNTSLSALYADDNMATVITGLKASREIVDKIMADLQNPTDEFSACYSIADSLYDAYCGLVDLAISPTGSYNTYSANFGEYDDDLLKYYRKLEMLIPSE